MGAQFPSFFLAATYNTQIIYSVYQLEKNSH